MALSSCYCHSHISSLKVGRSTQASRLFPLPATERRTIYALRGANADVFGQQVSKMGRVLQSEWSFVGGSKVFLHPKVARIGSYGKGFSLSASCGLFWVVLIWVVSGCPPTHLASVEPDRHIYIKSYAAITHAGLTSTQIASHAFTIGTAAVLPFYTLMVVAPKAELTKKTMESNIPYVALGILYAYLLYLAWTPDTLRMMFASKYWLPELPGILKMFSSEMTLASAWVHLLAVDLFAARQVFHDGLKNEIETRHSVSLCLLFCPIGILTHVITKGLTKRGDNMK